MLIDDKTAEEIIRGFHIPAKPEVLSQIQRLANEETPIHPRWLSVWRVTWACLPRS
ncbi:hypothetical protein [Candidatus Reidiella endopervernicosa]|uniref:Uncharacterized protein n=1 Tax=Candidatus Reidiella endopervernicosa TaxID=2738883 RepID=A0A6N0HRV9_9GAMM|nr:hypothetical protein [Candidatus Reidiella endopervernicosa]QKQ25001.1 hypothetical protein HUE57_00890 [Candidatus Reidiella endopervernicosa]